MKVLIVGVGVIGTVYGAQLGTAGHGISVLPTAIAQTRSPLTAYAPGTSSPASRRTRWRRSSPLRESRMSTSCWSPCGATISRARPVRSPRSRPMRWCYSWATTRPDVRAFLAGQRLCGRHCADQSLHREYGDEQRFAGSVEPVCAGQRERRRHRGQQPGYRLLYGDNGLSDRGGDARSDPGDHVNDQHRGVLYRSRILGRRCVRSSL